MMEQFSLCRNFIAAPETKGGLCGRINEEKIMIIMESGSRIP